VRRGECLSCSERGRGEASDALDGRSRGLLYCIAEANWRLIGSSCIRLRLWLALPSLVVGACCPYVCVPPQSRRRRWQCGSRRQVVARDELPPLLVFLLHRSLQGSSCESFERDFPTSSLMVDESST